MPQDAGDLLPAERKVVEELGHLPLDFRAMAAVSNLFRASAAIRRHMEAKVLADDRLSWTSFVAMWVLWVWGEMESRDLAAAVGISRPTSTGVVTTLEGRGYVRRSKTADDGRLVRVTLTDAGRSKIEELFPRFNAEEVALTTHLDAGAAGAARCAAAFDAATGRQHGRGSLMTTNDAAPSARPAPERRWPMATAVLVAIVLQVITPHTGRLVFWWVFPVLEVAALLAVIVRDPGRIDRRTRAARRTTLVLIALLTVGTLGGLVVLALDVVDKSYAYVGATALLGRGAALWVTNVVVFSLWFWEVDRGGAAERAAASKIPPSFGFPEEAMPELAPEGWIPRYPDYLFLSFTNATAFSPTDTLPVRIWAKMTMMVESVISLITAILVIARAINVLPG